MGAILAMVPGMFASPFTPAQAQEDQGQNAIMAQQYDRGRDGRDMNQGRDWDRNRDRSRDNQDRWDRDRDRGGRDYTRIRDQFRSRYFNRYNYYQTYRRSAFDRRYDFDRFMLTHRFYFDRYGRICGIDRYGRFFCVYFDSIFQYPYRFYLDTWY